MEGVNVYALIGATGTVCAMIFGYLGYQKGLKTDAHDSGASQGELRSGITYIMRRVDESLLEQKEVNKNLNSLTERVTRVEESSKQAHKRIDNIAGHRSDRDG